MLRKKSGDLQWLNLLSNTDPSPRRALRIASQGGSSVITYSLKKFIKKNFESRRWQYNSKIAILSSRIHFRVSVGDPRSVLSYRKGMAQLRWNLLGLMERGYSLVPEIDQNK